MNRERIMQRMQDAPGSRGRNSYVESSIHVENSCRSKGKGINFTSQVVQSIRCMRLNS